MPKGLLYITTFGHRWPPKGQMSPGLADNCAARTSLSVALFACVPHRVSAQGLGVGGLIFASCKLLLPSPRRAPDVKGGMKGKAAQHKTGPRRVFEARHADGQPLTISLQVGSGRAGVSVR